MVLFIIAFIGLGILGAMVATDTRTLVARILSFVYFAFFLGMPFYTKLDTNKPVPERVTMSTTKQKNYVLCLRRYYRCWCLLVCNQYLMRAAKMKQTLKNWFAALLLAVPMSAAVASGGHANYEKVDIDLRDQVSLQHGAQIFTNYCLSCHSASGMRFNRLKDIGLTEDEIKKNLMFTTDNVGDVMVAAMDPKDASKWLGAPPPDLTLIARSKGADYLYAYMRGFYKDPTRPTGWNNTVLAARVCLTHCGSTRCSSR